MTESLPSNGVSQEPAKGISLWFLAGSISYLLLLLPLLVVRIPPISDLPQQLAQIRLLHLALSHGGGPLVVGWLDPNRLSYLVLQLGWWLGGPVYAGRVTMALFGALWVAACFWLAWRRRRPADAAVLAVLLFFNHVTYWGFFGFMLGWPVFVLWLELSGRSTGVGRRAHMRHTLLLTGVGLLLFESHVLWWAAGCIWLGAESLLSRRARREWIDRAISQAPLALWAALWFPLLAREGFGSRTVWGTGFLGRLSPMWLSNAFLGGLRGPVEPVILVLLVAWMVVSVLQHRSKLARSVDGPLLLAALLLGLLVFTLPQKHTNTIEFASRWAPCALALLLLALPAPRLRAKVRMLIAIVLLAGLTATTAVTWLRFDRTEMSGFEQAMAALPPRPHVLGLDFVRESRLVKGYPFLQMFAYSQVLHGGGLNFSFADFATSLVRFEPRRHIPWTEGLEWFPALVKPRDLGYFDYVLVCGKPRLQAVFARRPRLDPVTKTGTWRLYRVSREASELTPRKRSTPRPVPRAGG